MKKILFAAIAASIVGLASASVPASAAMPVPGMSKVDTLMIDNVQYRPHRNYRHHRHYKRHRHCFNRRVVTHRQFGPPIVRYVRVCR